MEYTEIIQRLPFMRYCSISPSRRSPESLTSPWNTQYACQPIFPSSAASLRSSSSLNRTWKGRGKLVDQNMFQVDESTPERLGSDQSHPPPRLSRATDRRRRPRRKPYRFDLGERVGVRFPLDEGSGWKSGADCCRRRQRVPSVEDLLKRGERARWERMGAASHHSAPFQHPGTQQLPQEPGEGTGSLPSNPALTVWCFASYSVLTTICEKCGCLSV